MCISSEPTFLPKISSSTEIVANMLNDLCTNNVLLFVMRENATKIYVHQIRNWVKSLMESYADIEKDEILM